MLPGAQPGTSPTVSGHPVSVPSAAISGLVLFLAMELSWLSLLIGLVWIGWGSGRWPFPWVLLMPSVAGVLGGRLTPVVWGRRRWYDLYRWGLGVGVAASCGRIALAMDGLDQVAGPFLLALAIGLILYWRGWFIGEDPPDSAGIEAAFQVGAVAVLPLMALLQWNRPGAGQWPAVAFFMFGLLSIGLARRGERRTQGTGPEPDWLAMALGLGICTLGVAAVLVVLVSPDLLQVLADQLLWVVRLIASLIGGLFSGLGQPPSRPSESEIPAAIPSPAAVTPPIGVEIPWPLLWLMERLADLLLVLLFAFGVHRLVQFGLRRARRRWADPDRGEAPRSEAIAFSWSAWWRELWARLLGRLWPGRRAAATGNSVPRSATEATREQQTAREVYRGFLTAAARLGLPRSRPQTPNEYARHLATRRPAGSAAVAELTDTYVRVRYGEERIDGRQLARMRSAAARAGEALREQAGDPAG
jgi:hypothetical protein